MHLKTGLSAIAIAIMALTAASAHAAPSALQRSEIIDAVSGDVPQRSSQHDPAATVKKAVPGLTTAVSDDDVGDSDSFGRNVKWLGLASMNVTLLRPASSPGW